jgi:2-hydroxyglutarate dehydrogenase
MLYLLSQFDEQSGDIVYNTTVTNIAPRSGGGYDITVAFNGGESTIHTGVVVNSVGLYACNISNMLLPPERHLTPYYAKGNYFSYSASKPKPRRLLYPCPEKNFAGYFPSL